MNLDDHILLWNLASIKVLDIRQMTMNKVDHCERGNI